MGYPTPWTGCTPPARRILFVCVGNANRSQMAEAFARMHGQGRVEAWSAGSRPTGRVNPTAIEAMRERGCDLSAQRSKHLDEIPKQPWDAVVTMGCGDVCPSAPARVREDWRIPDPADMPLEEFRCVRDRIEREVRTLLERVGG